MEHVTVTFEIEHIRNIGQNMRKDKGGFTTVQAEAFLALYGTQLQEFMRVHGSNFICAKVK